MKTDLLQGFYLGGLLVDPRSGQVIGRDGSVHLPPKAMEVLLCLASNPGNLVTREEIIDSVWGEGHGSAEALTHAVSAIRHAFDDHREQARFVQTLPKRGYRLIAGVTAPDAYTGSVVLGTQNATSIHELGLFENLKQRGVLETALAYLVVGWLLIQIADIVFGRINLPDWIATFVTFLVIAGFPIAILLSWFLEFRDGRAIPHELSPSDSAKRRFSRTYLSVLGALAIAGMLVSVYDYGVGLPMPNTPMPQDISERAPLPPVQENSIAVLRFYNLDGSDTTQIFSDGLADDVINALSRVPGLLVSARGDSFTLDPNSASSRVRERLRVALYLEGSVQIDGDTMRVIVQLIDSETGFHIFSRTFDTALAGFFKMRDEIAELTVANIRVALPPETQVTPVPAYEASSLDAYVLYRHGKDLSEQPRTIESLGKVTDFYEKALTIDPQYAAAHAGICDAFVTRYKISNAPDDIFRAEEACASALTMSPRLAMVHTALGGLYLGTSREPEAYDAFSAALAINPHDVQAMIGLSSVYARQQRHDEAENILKAAVDTQPGNWRTITGLGNFYFAVGRYVDAAESFRQVVTLNPDNFHARTNLGSAFSMAGDFDAGKRVFEESIAIQESPTAYSNLGVIYYYLGNYEDAVGAQRRATKLSSQEPVNWLNLADALYFDGRQQEALTAFGRSESLARRRLAIDPNDVETLLTLAWAQQMLGKTAEARESINRSMTIAPNDPYGFYYQALVEIRSGDSAAAIDALRLAADNGYPTNMLAAEPYLMELRDCLEFQRILSGAH